MTRVDDQLVAERQQLPVQRVEELARELLLGPLAQQQRTRAEERLRAALPRRPRRPDHPERGDSPNAFGEVVIYAPRLTEVSYFRTIFCASLAIGNLAALAQRNVKRLLAYSSIAHMGFALMGLAAAGSTDVVPPLGRATEAIEPIGERRALVVANNGGNLHLALIELGASPRVAARVPADGVGYFQGAMYDVAHRADGGDSGLIAVPFGVTPEPFLWRATSLAIYRYDAAGLRRLGRVAAREEPSGFGEVKPVFAQGRIFAMLGDELVEVAEEGDGLREVRRISLDFETRK